MASDEGTGRGAVRRRDRTVADDAWIRTMLHAAGTGVLATVDAGQPFVNANLFVYDEARNAIYLHTARLGRTRTNLEADEHVAFTVTELGRLLPADEALEFSTEYASVVVFGRGTVVTEPEQARRCLQMLLDKYFPDLRPGVHYRPITDDELKRTSVFRIAIEEWSGKRKVATPDFPGARPYPVMSMIRD